MMREGEGGEGRGSGGVRAAAAFCLSRRSAPPGIEKRLQVCVRFFSDGPTASLERRGSLARGSVLARLAASELPRAVAVEEAARQAEHRAGVRGALGVVHGGHGASSRGGEWRDRVGRRRGSSTGKSRRCARLSQTLVECARVGDQRSCARQVSFGAISPNVVRRPLSARPRRSRAGMATAARFAVSRVRSTRAAFGDARARDGSRAGRSPTRRAARSARGSS